MAEKNVLKKIHCFRLLLEIWNVLHGKKKKIHHFMHGLASWQTPNYFLDSSCITLSFVTSSLIERGKKDLHLNAGWKTHFRCLSWSKHDTSNEGKKDFMPTFGALQAMDEIYLSSNRLVFAVDTYSCQYDPCSWSKSWKSYGNVDNEREKTGR